MHMKVKNGLAAIRVRVDNDTVAFLLKALLPRDLGGRQQQVPERIFLRGPSFRKRVDVFTRDQQNVRRGLRRCVVEGDAYVVLKHLVRPDLTRGYLAENTILLVH